MTLHLQTRTYATGGYAGLSEASRQLSAQLLSAVLIVVDSFRCSDPCKSVVLRFFCVLFLCRYTGQDDPVAEKILRLAASRSKAESIEPPADPSITTLHVGGLTKDINSQDLRDAFYGFGELLCVKMCRSQSCAFLCYAQRSSAEEAIKHMHSNLVIKGTKLRLAWAKPSSDEKNKANKEVASPDTSGDTVIPPPLPGLPPVQSSVLLPFMPWLSVGGDSSSQVPGFGNSAEISGGNIVGIGGSPPVYASMNPKEAEYVKR